MALLVLGSAQVSDEIDERSGSCQTRVVVADHLGCAEFQTMARQLGAWGCTDAEVAEVEADQGVPLPASYRCFLSTMGRDAGGLFGGTDLCFPDLLGLRCAAVDLLDEWRESGVEVFDLPADAVVISMHQGYAFEFVRSSRGDDPPVEWWAEGSGHPESSGTSAARVIDWLRQERDSPVLPPHERDRHRRETRLSFRLRVEPPVCMSCGSVCAWSVVWSYNSKDDADGRGRLIVHCQSCRAEFWRWTDSTSTHLRRLRPPLGQRLRAWLTG